MSLKPKRRLAFHFIAHHLHIILTLFGEAQKVIQLRILATIPHHVVVNIDDTPKQLCSNQILVQGFILNQEVDFIGGSDLSHMLVVIFQHSARFVSQLTVET